MDYAYTGLGCCSQSICCHLWGGSSTTMMNRLHKNNYMVTFANIDIDLPPLSEHKTIANALSALDAKIDNNKTINYHFVLAVCRDLHVVAHIHLAARFHKPTVRIGQGFLSLPAMGKLLGVPLVSFFARLQIFYDVCYLLRGFFSDRLIDRKSVV